MRRVAGAVVAALAWLATARAAAAQRPSGTQAEWRVDAVGARTPALQLGGGANIPAGLYARLAAALSAGAAHRDGVTHLALRADATARFHFDPFREGRRALYALGGLSLLHDPFEEWRPRLHAGLGLEGARRGRYVMAVELALGGGVRVGAVMRRARAIGR